MDDRAQIVTEFNGIPASSGLCRSTAASSVLTWLLHEHEWRVWPMKYIG